jgi:hypothetical protein
MDYCTLYLSGINLQPDQNLRKGTMRESDLLELLPRGLVSLVYGS